MPRLLIAIIGLLVCLNISATGFAQKKGKLLTNEDISPPSEAEKEPAPDIIITIERSICFGPCPAYKMTIYGNGKVVYEGKEYNPIKGSKTFTVKREVIKQLMAEFEKVKYFAWKDAYTGGPTDSQTVITSYTLNGKKKSISHYLASPDAPKELSQLENSIDTIIGPIPQ